MSTDETVSTDASPANLAILEAIESAGGLGELAKRCRVRYQAVQKWIKNGKVPAERVLDVESASGVPRSRIRPDLYPPAREEQLPQLQSGTGCA